MTRAYIPDRDLPNFEGKPRDVQTTMGRLRERVMVGKFLAVGQPKALAEFEREADDAMGQLREATGSTAFDPDLSPWVKEEVDKHRLTHGIVSRFGRPPRRGWCGRCVLGNDVWSRYEAGLIQPILPTDDVPEPVEVTYTPPDGPRRPILPTLPPEGFTREQKHDRT